MDGRTQDWEEVVYDINFLEEGREESLKMFLT